MLWQPIVSDDPYKAKHQRRFLDEVRSTYSEYKPPEPVTAEFVYNNEPISEKTFMDSVFKRMEKRERFFDPIDLDAVGDRFAKGTLYYWHETANRERDDKLREFDNKSMYPFIDNLVKTHIKLLSTGQFGAKLPFCNQLKKQFNCKPTQLYDHIKDWKLGLRRTVAEWYNLYDERYRMNLHSMTLNDELQSPERIIIDAAFLAASEGSEDAPTRHVEYRVPKSTTPKKTTKATAKYAFNPIAPAKHINKGKNPKKSDKRPPIKPPGKKPDKRQTISDNSLPYPFKSKLKQYQKEHPDVEYVEIPEQPKVNYKELYRPYFSSELGAWEIDHCFDMLEKGDAWLFCVNVNTRYLVVYKCKFHKGHKENAKETLGQLKLFIKDYEPKSIRGDGSSAYVFYGKEHEYLNRVITPQELLRDFNELKISTNSDTHKLMQLYMNNGITIYFNSSPFTLHNKMVDVAIKTIRNAIGYRKLQPKHMDQLVEYYNNTVHRSIGCTPAEMQTDPELEYQYIRWCERKLSDSIDAQREQKLLEYQVGNILMVHIDNGKTSDKHEKRRRFFDRLGEFVRYDYGNVVVKLLVKPVRVNTRAVPKIEVTVPIYHTKYVSKNLATLPKSYNDYYIASMKEIEVETNEENPQ